MRKKDMSYLAQALRWWGQQTDEGPIPNRHHNALVTAEAISFDEYAGTYALTPKGIKLIDRCSEAVQ